MSKDEAALLLNAALVEGLSGKDVIVLTRGRKNYDKLRHDDFDFMMLILIQSVGRTDYLANGY